MTQLNRMPTYGEQLTQAGQTTRGWYTLWSGLWSGQPTGIPSGVTVGASPFTYTALVGGSVIVQGGTVSQLAISRDGTTFYVTGLTAGVIPLSQNDKLKITYTVTPTVTFLPR